MDEPVFGVDFESGEGFARFEDRDEQYHQLYLYWTPIDQIGVSAKVVYDLYESEIGIATEFDNLPERVRTFSVPVGVSYFNPSGLFATLGGTYVDQKVRRSAFSTQGQGDGPVLCCRRRPGLSVAEAGRRVQFGDQQPVR
jgi:hypothetical protein